MTVQYQCTFLNVDFDKMYNMQYFSTMTLGPTCLEVSDCSYKSCMFCYWHRYEDGRLAGQRLEQP